MKQSRIKARNRRKPKTRTRKVLTRARKGCRTQHKVLKHPRRKRQTRNFRDEESASTDSQDVWFSACKNIQIPDTVAKCWLRQVRARMSQDSGRFFHNWSELVEPKARYLLDASELLVFAVCFQYYEYDVKKSCVAANCRAFRDFCSEGGYHDEASIKKVERLLGNENVETYEGFESDVQTLQDLDLIVLGLPEDQYKNYTRLLRKEYSHLNDGSYKSMRSKYALTSETQVNRSVPRDSSEVRKPCEGLFERLTSQFRSLRFAFSPRPEPSSPPVEILQRKHFASVAASHRKRSSTYKSHAYNPNKEKPPPGKRMVILDGSNVAFAHSNHKFFSVKGIQIALECFEQMGHEVKAVVPQNRLRKDASSDPALLQALHRAGKIVLTPCKNLMGRSRASYDDRFILELAIEFDAAVVSNDNFNDLVGENAEFKKVIETRVIGYTWCKDVFMIPKDPYGCDGPSLQSILNRA